MEWDILWGFFKTIVVPALAGIGGARYLGKKILEQALSKDMEKYRTELTQKTEGLKSQLSIYAHEQNVVASRIDGQRADAIKRVYAAICAWKTATEKLIGDCPIFEPDPEIEETEYTYYLARARESHSAGNALFDLLENQAIYFESALYEKLSVTVHRIADAVFEIVKCVDDGITVGMDYEDIVPEAMRQRKQLKTAYDAEFTPLFAEIINEFRRILGSMKG
jgi:hypothetical protein